MLAVHGDAGMMALPVVGPRTRDLPLCTSCVCFPKKRQDYSGNGFRFEKRPAQRNLLARLNLNPCTSHVVVFVCFGGQEIIGSEK